MNKAIVVGIIAAVVGIGIVIALAAGSDMEKSGESSNIEVETTESGGSDFKITLKEDLGIEGTPLDVNIEIRANFLGFT